MRVPALALLLSRMPARLPSRLARRGARPDARIRGSAVGSYSRSPLSLIDVSFPDGNLLGAGRIHHGRVPLPGPVLPGPVLPWWRWRRLHAELTSLREPR